VELQSPSESANFEAMDKTKKYESMIVEMISRLN